jgi:trk system potassium uptake protein TrkH
MQIKAVLKITSFSIIIVGLAMILSALVSLIYAENLMPLLISGFLALVFGGLIYFVGRKAGTDSLGIAEGCAVVTFSWVFICIFGALPFYLMGYFDAPVMINWTKSYYEAVSGFTTTGSSIFTDVEILPKGILFWRSFTHVFGGMGIVVLAVAILPKLGIGGMHGFRMESPGPLKSDKLVPRISQTAKILYTVYLVVLVIMIISLKLAGVNWFDSVLHAFGAIGTGGFSNYNTSVAGLHNHLAEYLLGFFMWISGVSFALTYLALFKGNFKVFWQDVEFKVYLAISGIAIFLITIGLFFTKTVASWSDAFRLAFFQVPTIMTTTGYATTDFNLWPVFPVSVLILLMFIGGSTGSTSGGLKVLRHIINFKLIKQELVKIFQPNMVSIVKIGGRLIDESIVRSVAALTFIYLLTFLIGAFALTLFNIDLVTAFTASIANLGNIGPGLNIVGPAGNYSSIPTPALWVLIFLMLLGRLEIYTILILFLPKVWKK